MSNMHMIRQRLQGGKRPCAVRAFPNNVSSFITAAVKVRQFDIDPRLLWFLDESLLPNCFWGFVITLLLALVPVGFRKPLDTYLLA